MPAIGQCELCLQKDAQLQESHFLSKGIYKILRDRKAKNPNPFLITKTTSVQTSRQLKRYLFCQVCEDCLNRNGEAWVLKHCLQNDGRFPLANVLALRDPNLQSPDNPTRVYYAAEIPEIRIPCLAYFAASIFWRGSVYPWNEDGSTPVELGPFQERFRRYLIGEESFPREACLWVAVREGKNVDRLTHVPMGVRRDGLHAYKFPMPGLAFTLIVGKNIPAKHRALCLVHGSGNPVVVTPILEEWLAQGAARLLQRVRTKADFLYRRAALSVERR
jgi:hypothetical protein